MNRWLLRRLRPNGVCASVCVSWRKALMGCSAMGGRFSFGRLAGCCLLGWLWSPRPLPPSGSSEYGTVGMADCTWRETLPPQCGTASEVVRSRLVCVGADRCAPPHLHQQGDCVLLVKLQPWRTPAPLARPCTLSTLRCMPRYQPESSPPQSGAHICTTRRHRPVQFFFVIVQRFAHMVGLT